MSGSPFIEPDNPTGRYEMPFGRYDAPRAEVGVSALAFDNILIEAGCIGAGAELGTVGLLRFHFSSSSGQVHPPIDMLGTAQTLRNIAQIVHDAVEQIIAIGEAPR